MGNGIGIAIRGTVVWFNNVKGYGFLKPDGGGDDVFVHYSAIQDDGYKKLDEGDVVEFRVEAAKDGRKQATDVVKIEGK